MRISLVSRQASVTSVTNNTENLIMKTFTALKRATLGWNHRDDFRRPRHHATAAALTGQLTLRPLTPQETKDYSLTGSPNRQWFENRGHRQPAYLDALIGRRRPARTFRCSPDVDQCACRFGRRITNSPLGTNVPPPAVGSEFAQGGGRVMFKSRMWWPIYDQRHDRDHHQRRPT